MVEIIVFLLGMAVGIILAVRDNKNSNSEKPDVIKAPDYVPPSPYSKK